MRQLSGKELADLPTNWENSTIDTTRYCQSVTVAFEVDEKGYNLLKREGVLVQKYKDRFYIGAFL